MLEENGLAGYYFDWLEHPDDDEYWRQWRIEAHHERITIPVLAFGGWYDMFLRGTLRNFLGLRERGGSEEARTGQRLIIGPWAHGKPLFGPNPDPAISFGLEGTAFDVEGLSVRWFDYWLKGIDNRVLDETPAVTVFTLGENRWRQLADWPVPGTQWVDYYLHDAGRLSTEPPAEEPADVYLYDPRRPVPTVGGPAYGDGGARDQRAVESRPDVLVYTSEPLAADVRVTGPIAMRLWAETTARDTDFTAKLVNVAPDGLAMNLADGIVRARYRNGQTEPQLVEPGTVVEYTIDLDAASNVFRAGHRIRVEVSSSNFPRFDANPNTGGIFGEDGVGVAALQTVHHSSARPSHITLPVIPVETS